MFIIDWEAEDIEEDYRLKINKITQIDNSILSRCTGLKDFQGDYIFENDIVRSRFNDIIKAKVIWDDDTASFRLDYGDGIPPVGFCKGDSKNLVIVD